MFTGPDAINVFQPLPRVLIFMSEIFERTCQKLESEPERFSRVLKDGCRQERS